MTEPTGQPVEEFLATVPSRRRWADAHRLIELMRDVTGEEPVMWGPSVIGFGQDERRPLVAFALHRAKLVVQLVPGFDDRYASALARLGPHKTGPGALVIKNLNDVDLDVLRELVARSTRVART